MRAIRDGPSQPTGLDRDGLGREEGSELVSVAGHVFALRFRSLRMFKPEGVRGSRGEGQEARHEADHVREGAFEMFQDGGSATRR